MHTDDPVFVRELGISLKDSEIFSFKRQNSEVSFCCLCQNIKTLMSKLRYLTCVISIFQFNHEKSKFLRSVCFAVHTRSPLWSNTSFILLHNWCVKSSTNDNINFKLSSYFFLLFFAFIVTYDMFTLLICWYFLN